MIQIVVASSLRDGRVVFLGRNDRWVADIQQSRVGHSTEECDEMLSLARASEALQEVVDPYLVEVALEGERIWPVVTREAIRAAGPTVRRDLGKQAEG